MAPPSRGSQPGFDLRMRRVQPHLPVGVGSPTFSVKPLIGAGLFGVRTRSLEGGSRGWGGVGTEPVAGRKPRGPQAAG